MPRWRRRAGHIRYGEREQETRCRSMPSFATLPIEPMQIRFDFCTSAVQPAGPVLTRRMSSLSGLFAREDLRAAEASGEDAVVYSVVSSPVPEIARELPPVSYTHLTLPT